MTWKFPFSFTLPLFSSIYSQHFGNAILQINVALNTIKCWTLKTIILIYCQRMIWRTMGDILSIQESYQIFLFLFIPNFFLNKFFLNHEYAIKGFYKELLPFYELMKLVVLAKRIFPLSWNQVVIFFYLDLVKLSLEFFSLPTV